MERARPSLHHLWRLNRRRKLATTLLQKTNPDAYGALSRNRLITRSSQKRKETAASLRQYCPTQTAFNAWLGRRYEKCWILHCAKPTNNHTHTVNYLGRYIKRPPLSQSRLKHYNGSAVHFNFHDHKSKKQKTFHASATEFIRRFVQHIPDKHLRIVRYYGVLANRKRKTLLPKVYDALNQSERKQFFFRFAYLYKQTFGQSPLDCILCNTKMKLAAIKPGLSLKKIMPHHQKIALAKPMII